MKNRKSVLTYCLSDEFYSHFHLNVILFFSFFARGIFQNFFVSFSLLLTCNIFFRGRGEESCATRTMQTIARGEGNLETAVRTRVAINSPVFARLLCEIIGCCTWSLRRSELPWPVEYTGTYSVHTHTRTHVKKGGGIVDPDPRELQPDYFQLFSLTVRWFTFLSYVFPPPPLLISVDNVYIVKTTPCIVRWKERKGARRKIALILATQRMFN